MRPFPTSRRAVSPQLAAAIDHEIKALMEQAHQMALEILMRNRDVLERIAQTLLDAESLEGETLKAFLTQIKRPTDLQTWLDKGALNSALLWGYQDGKEQPETAESPSAQYPHHSDLPSI
ncbi:hypothetical protein IQ254_30165 [Nodosilinea sp. LEGE 07088]|nr:hypothetical protein [Nodosilinea sp. LEGE 07088]